jgi:hypothetical protein
MPDICGTERCSTTTKRSLRLAAAARRVERVPRRDCLLPRTLRTRWMAVIGVLHKGHRSQMYGGNIGQASEDLTARLLRDRLERVLTMIPVSSVCPHRDRTTSAVRVVEAVEGAVILR